MKSWIELSYDEKSHPVTTYPDKLIEYLCDRYSLPCGSVLEVGCGRGDFIHAFQKRGFIPHTVDIEVRPKSLHEDIIFNTVNAEIENLPYDDNFFDVVFTKSVLEHIQNYNHFISECKRVLKSGGTLIVMTPDWFSCHYIFYIDYTHIRPYTVQSLSKLLLSHDLNLISCERFIQYPAVWRNPFLKSICRILQCFGPVRKARDKTSFFRWSRELIVLAAARKN